ncbi:hypothetical protein AB6A40_001151 [Gnathostoma spinigerum]|uniref:Papilin n=1 Tax=Gnathostoma spinigerum TaxID=75299 RepID=A0ABD6E5M6_9BILA
MPLAVVFLFFQCEKCNDTEETREVTCRDKNGRQYPIEKCLSNSSIEIPIDKRACATPAPCVYEWHASQWSKCSTECGHGHKTRRVVCGIYQLGDLEIVDEFHCNADLKLKTEENCTNEEKCTGTYYTGPWSECTAQCGGGTQSRMIVCLNYDKIPVPEWCDESDKPAEEQTCNTDPCPTCDDSEFGCCPDNTTFATGAFMEGCSNCSQSEFGCCSDNVTYAEGANMEGCPDYETGSGEDVDVLNATKADEAKIEMCEVSNAETGESATVQCAPASALNETIEIEDLLDNITARNESEHCSKSEFGCCPDWYTPATGKDNEGCPIFTQGACNDTMHGCCPDEVTLARGPNYEGCGEPSCAASLYGCCKDRKTIAFGPHYAGCDRTSFPCELSKYGCCSDGETAALGSNGTGCGEDCLLSKYGCCPDGVTSAKSVHNDGCGCQYSQYGCCPDGKTAAQGAGFIGCPDSCAQSQFGCCPDGKTMARGPKKEGCPCQYTRYGCCPDGETAALGPRNEGCDDCRYAKYGCCPDGETRATGPEFAGCPVTTIAPYIFDGTVAPSRIVSCALPQDQGTVCHPGYKLVWYYDSSEGRCTQFWYGGCDGNENNFASKEQCETICVEPPERGRCYLPKVEGPIRCDQLAARYWYDYTTKQCGAFWWRGCLGNANNFESWEECQTFCQGVGPIESTSEIPERDNVLDESPYPHDSRYPEQTQSDSHRDHSPQVYKHPRQEEPRILPQGYPSRPYERNQSYREPPSYSQLQEESASRIAEEPRPLPASDRDRSYGTTGKQSVCEEPKETGPCDKFVTKWYYNKRDGTCTRFHYGGCEGTRNRFDTEEECKVVCGDFIDACELPKVTGPCSGRHQRYFYDQNSRDCKLFEFGGCLGNSNNFVTIADCRRRCIASSSHDIIETTTHQPTSDICSLPADVGPCRTPTPAYYYDSALGSCVEFTYGGCEGNNNRFESMEECQNACRTQPQHQALTMPDGEVQPPERSASSEVHEKPNKESYELDQPSEANIDGKSRREEVFTISTRRRTYPLPSSPVPELCQLPEDIGPCYGRTLRWRFDSETQACVTFAYSGCGGNANMFTSQEACERACGPFRDQASDVCGMEMDRGSCELGLTRWYYDTRLRECHPFMYSGCGGNGNRFSTKAECENLCAAESTNKDDDEDVCSLERDSGPCTDPLTQWYFDSNDMECKLFTYGGCRGNKNRFDTRRQCERRCLPSSMKAEVFNASEACSLPFEAGPCRDSQQKWYYDNTSGKCRLFVYGGCMGNLNRFDSEHECTAACLQTDQKIDVFRATVKETRSSPHSVGSDVDVECETNGLTPVRWFKNGEEINFDSNSYSQLQLTTGNSRLTIKDAKTSDSGSYACSAGPTTILSDPIKIIVEGRLLPDSCVDEGNEATCRLVVKANLCTNVRYGRFCCRSCSAVGYSFRF